MEGERRSVLHIECGRREKSSWVRAASGRKLADWVRETLNEAAGMSAAKSITITTRHPMSVYGVPVCLVRGSPVDGPEGIRACLERLGWDRHRFAEEIGKSLSAIDAYLSRGPGNRPAPAEVWNVLKDALENNQER